MTAGGRRLGSAEPVRWVPARTGTVLAGLLARAWLRFVALGVAVCGGYYLLPLLGPAGPLAQVVTYEIVNCAPVVAIAVGVIRYAPAARAPWYLIAAGQALTAVGEAVFDVQHQILGSTADIGAPDLFYLASYPLQALGLLLFVRSRTPGWHVPSLLDATIVTISAALLSWMFLIGPTVFAGDTSPLVRAVSAAYPLMDLLLLAMTARLMLGAGPRSPSFWLLAAGLAVAMAADSLYVVQSLLDTYQDGNALDAVWMFGVILVGASALHPSMTALTHRSPAAGPDASPGRLAVLAVAALLAPAALLIQYLRDEDLYIPMVVASCMALFLLVIVRMAGLVRAQRHVAITDALTGLRTRRYVEEALITEAERAGRHGGSVGLLLLDIDHFKGVNDTHGHHGGDLVLSEVAHRLRALIRATGVVARYGGEEFAVLLPGARAADLEAVGDRLRRGIAGTPIGVNQRTLLTVTVSIGGAALPEHAETVSDLTLIADRALYAAKESGRNRVVTAHAVAA